MKVSRLDGMLGAGVYFAEDAAKMDQYTRPDSSFEQEGLEEPRSFLRLVSSEQCMAPSKKGAVGMGVANGCHYL